MTNMKNLTIVILLLAMIGISADLEDDTKIGYVYMELVLNNMDETKEVMELVNRFTTEKEAELAEKAGDLSTKFKEYQRQEKVGELSDAGRIIAEHELEGLQKALEALKARTDAEIKQKRSELLVPVARKLETAMDEVAAKYGYRYVLNSADGTGNSVVVVAPEADDLTQEVMLHLGIKFD